METLYIALIVSCIFLIWVCEGRKQPRVVQTQYKRVPPAAQRKAIPAPRPPTVPNSGMMNVSYGLAEEQARLYNNIPIPPTGVPAGYALKKANVIL